MQKLIAGVVVLMLILSISGCSQSNDNEDYSDNPYSREHVTWISQSNLFGTGRSDDEISALKYLYDSEEISEIYGDSFEITGEKIICHKSEGQSFFLPGIYKGEAIYEFVFDEKSYKITLSKKYFGKWTVVKCEQVEISD